MKSSGVLVALAIFTTTLAVVSASDGAPAKKLQEERISLGFVPTRWLEKVGVIKDLIKVALTNEKASNLVKKDLDNIVKAVDELQRETTGPLPVKFSSDSLTSQWENVFKDLPEQKKDPTAGIFHRMKDHLSKRDSEGLMVAAKEYTGTLFCFLLRCGYSKEKILNRDSTTTNTVDYVNMFERKHTKLSKEFVETLLGKCKPQKPQEVVRGGDGGGNGGAQDEEAVDDNDNL